VATLVVPASAASALNVRHQSLTPLGTHAPDGADGLGTGMGWVGRPRPSLGPTEAGRLGPADAACPCHGVPSPSCGAQLSYGVPLSCGALSGCSVLLGAGAVQGSRGGQEEEEKGRVKWASLHPIVSPLCSPYFCTSSALFSLPLPFSRLPYSFLFVSPPFLQFRDLPGYFSMLPFLSLQMSEPPRACAAPF